jgi:GntR family transcriptional regulator
MKYAAPPSTADEPSATELDMAEVFGGQSLDRKGAPLYRQIADILRELMESGSLRPGQALPREADLAATFNVSLITIRQALRDLEGEGRVRKQSAKPTIVTAPPPRASTSFNFKSLEAIIASTAGRNIKIIKYRQRSSARAREVFGLGRTEKVWGLEAVLHSPRRVVSHNVFYFPPAIGSRLSRRDFDDVVVFRAVQRRLGIELRNAHVTVRADIADATLAQQLGYTEGAAIMAVEMIYFDTKGQPVELTINRNRADAFSLEFDAPNQ